MNKKGKEKEELNEEESLAENQAFFNSLTPEKQKIFRSGTKNMYKSLCEGMEEHEAILNRLQAKVMETNRDIENKRPYSGAQARPSEELDMDISEVKENAHVRMTTWQSLISIFKDDENTVMRRNMLDLKERAENHVVIANKIQAFGIKNKETNPDLEVEVKSVQHHFSPILKEIERVGVAVKIQFQMKPSLIADYADVSTEPMDPNGGDD